jgi:hypothetical protein
MFALESVATSALPNGIKSKWAPQKSFGPMALITASMTMTRYLSPDGLTATYAKNNLKNPG